MKKILFAAAIALLAMGCCKKATTSEETACPCPEKKECCKKECSKANGEACAFEAGQCPCPAKCAAADSLKCCKGEAAACPKAECPQAATCPKAACPKADAGCCPKAKADCPKAQCPKAEAAQCPAAETK